MRDSYTNRPIIDQEFTDHSWKEMKKLLDQEMPVKRRRRRGLIWFFLVGAIGLALGIWFYGKNQPALLPVTAPIPIATESPTDNWINPQYNNPGENNQMPTDPTEQAQDRTHESSYSTIEAPGKASNNTVIPNPLKSNQNVNTPTPSTNLENINSQKGAEPTSSFIAQSTTPNPIIEKENLTFLNIPTTQNGLDYTFQLPTMELEALPAAATEEEEKVEPILPKRKIALGLSAGAAYDLSVLDRVGYTTGVELHIPFKQKWGIQTGLGYSLLPKTGRYWLQEIQETDYLDQTNFPANNGDPVPVQSSNVNSLRNIQNLELPILVTFQPLKPLRFAAGLNFSYLLKAKFSIKDNQRSIYDENDTFDFIELDQLDLSRVSYPKLDKTNISDKFLVAGVVGASWRPTSRWHLDLQYHYGLDRVVETFSTLKNEALNADGQGNYNPTVTTSSSGNAVAESTFIESLNQKTSVPQSFRLTIGYYFLR